MIYAFGAYRLDIDRLELWRGQEPVAVEPQVFGVLQCLIENRDRVVSKEDLIDRIWSGRFIADATLSARISAARRAVGDNGKDQAVIRTIAKRGFRFLAKARVEATQNVEPDPPASVSKRSLTPAGGARVNLPKDERRQLTVMHVDLAGWTTLSGGLDPEDYREITASVHKACTEAVQPFGGYIAPALGDSVVAYFGYPEAHEDDAERAVRAALRTIRSVEALQLPGKVKLKARIGIATGPVMVGDLADAREDKPHIVSGEAFNLAFRLPSLGGPDMVIVSESTYRLLGELFSYEALGTQLLFGVETPVRAWRVLDERMVESRFEAIHSTAFTEFVGREHEIDLLLKYWDHARDGEAQAVLLSGEPGIGKSRLAQVLCERLRYTANTRLRYQCSPYHLNSALHPIRVELELAARFASDDSVTEKLEKLETLLAETMDDIGAVAPLFADLLSLPVGGRYPRFNLTPQALKERKLDALVDRHLQLAKAQPLVMVFEDLQWLDPTTQEFLHLMLNRVQDARILMLMTFRPEYEAPWVGEAHVHLMTLNRLNKRECHEMALKVPGVAGLSESVLEEVIAKTDGVPLFVEELVRALIEVGTTEAIPSSIQASLQGRLDRLGPAKELAQIGSVIGRDFGYPLLAAAAGIAEEDLLKALEWFVASGLAFQRGTPPEATYTFKHALVQDAAYESLPKSKRQHLHGTIADIIVRSFSGIANSEPEMIARHYRAAGMHDDAIPFLVMAGNLCLVGSAFQESVSHLTLALDELSFVKSEKRRISYELEIRTALGTAYVAFLGWPSLNVRKTLEPAKKILASAKHFNASLTVLWNLWVHHATRCEFESASDYVERLFEFASEENHPSVTVAAHCAAVLTSCWMGDFAKTSDHVRSLRALYVFERDSALAATCNHDPMSVALLWDSWRLWIQGYPDQAQQAAQEQLELADRVDHKFGLTFALTLGSGVFIHRREPELQLKWVARAREIAQEQSLAFMEHCMCPYMRGLGLIEQSDLEAGYNELATASGIWEGIGGLLTEPFAKLKMASALGGLGRRSEGLRLAEEAISQGETTGHNMYSPEAYRILGHLLLDGGASGSKDAETKFDMAISLAQSQEAKSWELRAATSLARLWQSQGKNREARDLLVPVYGWFTEGFDTADLTDAKALLEALN